MNTTHTPDPEDSLLLAGLRQGQASAFEKLMRRYNRLLFRAARGIVHDDAEAQDAVQEGYLSAFVALESFRGQSSLGTWLTRIVINKALSQQRKLGRLVLWSEQPPDEDHDMPCDRPTGPSPSPEEEFARRQVRERLQLAVEALAPLYRSVFILRAVEGLSVEEAARTLQVSPDVVKTRYLRARALLRANLQAGEESEAAHLYDFQGARCDETVSTVIATLRSVGVIRDH
jgi:RNA polymerase sigma factor (sigma-70 family)